MRWYREELMKEAKKYKSLRQFRRMNINAYSSAQKQGLLSEMTWLESKRRKLTKDIVFDVAKGYTTKHDFCKYDVCAYMCAYRNGWLSEMDWMRMDKDKYRLSDDVLLAKARKYEYFKDFRNDEQSAYNLLWQRGLLGKTGLKRLRKSK